MEPDKKTLNDNSAKARCVLNISKKSTFLKYLLVFILSSSIGIYFRLFPLINYSPGDFREKATLIVIHQLREIVIKNIEANNPDLSPQEKALLIRTQFKYRKTESAEFNKFSH